MHILSEALQFPTVEKADRYGVIALGGDLSVERLMLAYRSGIFPWFEDGEPIIWWAPPTRMVLFPDEVKISKSMRNVINRNEFLITHNQKFEEVIANCAEISRNGQRGTWITDAMLEAYCKLHALGFAKSVEVWKDGELVGGLYGIDLGHIFCGESMFSKVPNASKFAFIKFAQQLSSQNYKLLDCQVYNDHLATLGAREIPRSDFMQLLKKQ